MTSQKPNGTFEKTIKNSSGKSAAASPLKIQMLDSLMGGCLYLGYMQVYSLCEQFQLIESWEPRGRDYGDIFQKSMNPVQQFANIFVIFRLKCV